MKILPLLYLLNETVAVDFKMRVLFLTTYIHICV